MNSVISKQLLINYLTIPDEIKIMVKDFAFRRIGKIHQNDDRYKLLLTIPDKNFDSSDGVTFVYLNINDDKDYYLTYINYEIQIQVFKYVGNVVHFVEGNHVDIL